MSQPHFAPPRVEIEKRADGVRILRSPLPLTEVPAHLGLHLRRWARERPDQVALAERAGPGWRALTWSTLLRQAEALGQAVLDLGAGPTRPVAVLSGNSVDHAVLMLGCLLAGVPIAPISTAYSLLCRDFTKLRHVIAKLDPALIFVDHGALFASALAALDFTDRRLVVGAGDPPSALAPVSHGLADLLETAPGRALAEAEAGLGPETIAKILFTSGSTGLPKGVFTTHGMLAANQRMIELVWPFVRVEPPVLVDWLPWNHCFGGNHNFNLVLEQGGTLFIDGGKPAPGLIDVTAQNLRLVQPTLYFNVPAGFAQLLPRLEEDAELRHSFFARLRLIFYAGAALPQDLWQRLEALALAERGEKVAMVSAWGSTETSPASTTVHFPIERAGVIGLPLPGVAIKMVPSGAKFELRVAGPHVMSSYLGEPLLTEAAFDEEGFYKIGDAGRLVDEMEPSRGLVFDGRIAEDFKLLSGVWVSAGQLRVEALAAAAPLLQDAVVTGENRPFVGLLAWLNLAACAQTFGAEAAAWDLAQACVSSSVRARLRTGLAQHNAHAGGSSRRIERVLLLVEPASIDRGEITDKGYINQHATLATRAAAVERLYAAQPDDEVIVI